MALFEGSHARHLAAHGSSRRRSRVLCKRSFRVPGHARRQPDNGLCKLRHRERRRRHRRAARAPGPEESLLGGGTGNAGTAAPRAVGGGGGRRRKRRHGWDRERGRSGGSMPSCAGGLSPCGRACVDTLTDAQNCGCAATACQSGESCSNGSCACLDGLTDCTGACVDLASSHENCGVCGKGARRTRSVPRAPAGSIARTGSAQCGGSCVDTQTSEQYCGDCDTGLSCREELRRWLLRVPRRARGACGDTCANLDTGIASTAATAGPHAAAASRAAAVTASARISRSSATTTEGREDRRLELRHVRQRLRERRLLERHLYSGLDRRDRLGRDGRVRAHHDHGRTGRQHRRREQRERPHLRGEQQLDPDHPHFWGRSSNT